MKIKELIKLLKNMDQEKEVLTEGCDCYGEPENVREESDYVLITRKS